MESTTIPEDKAQQSYIATNQRLADSYAAQEAHQARVAEAQDRQAVAAERQAEAVEDIARTVRNLAQFIQDEIKREASVDI
jgi:hypothetical protein